jgi:hypothetical protein
MPLKRGKLEPHEARSKSLTRINADKSRIKADFFKAWTLKVIHNIRCPPLEGEETLILLPLQGGD